MREADPLVKIRIEGVPIVLRDANTYRKIAEAYGTVIEPFEFSWETLDVSVGTRLVLHGSGKRIEEEMRLIWKNRTFQRSIREVEHRWPPDLNWNQSPVKSGEVGVQETGQMDLEEGKIQTVGGSDMVAETGFPVPALPVNKRGGEESAAESRHALHGETKSTHVGVDSLGSPHNPSNNFAGLSVGPSQFGPGVNVGRSTCASSRKRPRVIRSPSHLDYCNGQETIVDGGIMKDIPSFPDLNDPSYLHPYPSIDDIPHDFVKSDGLIEPGISSIIPESQLVGDTVNVEEEVANTIEIGECVGFQVGYFVDQVRLLVQGEGDVEGLQ
ncbi:hypothetical protein L1987_77366 [Smallanthus sonchifolius]|uniref:Uncharacterized protein n=1 Tax=Smallanthus sonchifolius TaxID=185202 RepID=A0ACB8Z9I4_9ASTR|nr:hypothetical protein L1987_77366 [Smallanthus sonchifolius]